ncbi:MAG: hypothetical protein IT372_02995, partial [Polyangiaceae bacterium]|nr:hypothetical protein [Polyangiaceae bacterium]
MKSMKTALQRARRAPWRAAAAITMALAAATAGCAATVGTEGALLYGYPAVY